MGALKPKIMEEQKPGMQPDQPRKTTSREYYLFAFRILGDFGVTIAVPVVLLVLVGHYADAKYGSSPLYTVLGFVIAALITIRIVRKKAEAYGNEYKKMNEAGKTEKNK